MATLALCQRDSYLRSSTNKVLSCTPIRDSDGKETFSVILDDSVLYPEGGGQPSDFGTINGVDILSLRKVDSTLYPSTSVEVQLPVAVDVDSEVECRVDWTRRFDHMQQHTAQHLLSGIAFKIFQADTVGWMLGTENVAVDLSLPRGGVLSPEEIGHLENEINKEIRRGAPVIGIVKSREESANESLVFPSGEAIGVRGAPKGAALFLDELRFIGISGLDANPCGGTHVQSLAELQLLKIISVEKDRESCRLRFLAGQRAISALTTSLARESRLSAILSVPPKSFETSIEKLMTDKRDLDKKYSVLTNELARKLGYIEVDNFVKGGQRILMLHRSGADLQFLLQLADSIVESFAPTSFSSNTPLIFLSGDELPVAPEGKKDKKKATKAAASPLATPVEGAFVMVGPPAIVSALKDEISAVLQGKSGGRPGRLQGQAKCISAETLQVVQERCLSSI